MRQLKLNKTMSAKMLFATGSIALLAACAGSVQTKVSSKETRMCLKSGWLADDVRNKSKTSLTNLAGACSGVANSDIKPSSADTARYNAAQLYRAAADVGISQSDTSELLGRAVSLGRPVLNKGLHSRTSQESLVLLNAVHGSQIQLGLSERDSPVCSGKMDCLKKGLEGLDRHGGSVRISDALASEKKSLQTAAANLQLSQAQARSKLARLQNGGSVHLSLENLQDLARRADRFSAPIAKAAELSHAEIATDHAELAVKRGQYATAAEYLKLATGFSEERGSDINIRAVQNIFLGDTFVMKAVGQNKKSTQPDASDLCDAANAFSKAFQSGDQTVRAKARRGFALAHALISDVSPGTCGASKRSALDAYRQANEDDGVSKLPPVHIRTYAELLSKTANDPAESLKLNRRRGGTSRLDAVFSVAQAPQPRPDPVITLALPSVSAWPLETRNTDVYNHMMLARQSRNAGNPAESIVHYEHAIAADGRWPVSALELGELLLFRRDYESARHILRSASDKASADKVKHARSFAHASYLTGRNELLRLRENLPAETTLALSASRSGADNSSNPVLDHQACLAALVFGSMKSEDVNYCESGGASPADVLFSAFGKVRKMQMARQELDRDRSNNEKQAAYLARAEQVETALRNMDSVQRATRVKLPVAAAEFSFGDLADMVVFIGERCQSERADLPTIANMDAMLSLLKLMKIDTCSGR